LEFFNFVVQFLSISIANNRASSFVNWCIVSVKSVISYLYLKVLADLLKLVLIHILDRFNQATAIKSAVICYLPECSLFKTVIGRFVSPVSRVALAIKGASNLRCGLTDIKVDSSS
jgi:hypothetical protein